MIEYAKYLDSSKTISFKVIDKKLLKIYTKIWGKISSLMSKEFDSELVYDDSEKYKKTKIESYGDNLNRNFQGKKYQKKMHHTKVCH